MGQAKQRGTREERIATAIEKKKLDASLVKNPVPTKILVGSAPIPPFRTGRLSGKRIAMTAMMLGLLSSTMGVK
jgi:hypothetical protein